MATWVTPWKKVFRQVGNGVTPRKKVFQMVATWGRPWKRVFRGVATWGTPQKRVFQGRRTFLSLWKTMGSRMGRRVSTRKTLIVREGKPPGLPTTATSERCPPVSASPGLPAFHRHA